MGDVRYSVKQLARLAGVSVRTLHVYDKLDLLKPSVRTDAGYRFCGEAELLRLQQILFYKELDLSLKAIAGILDDPGFDLVEALAGHKLALIARRDRLDLLLNTIDNTTAGYRPAAAGPGGRRPTKRCGAAADRAAL